MACGCLLLLIGSAFPRVALVLTWIFTSRVDIAFQGDWLLPLAGLIFLPYTTFFYVLAYAPIAGVEAIGWFFVGFGFLLDLASWLGSGREGQRRYDDADRFELFGAAASPSPESSESGHGHSSGGASSARFLISSTTVASARVVVSPRLRPSATSRSRRRMILPLRVLGSSGVR